MKNLIQKWRCRHLGLVLVCVIASSGCHQPPPGISSLLAFRNPIGDGTAVFFKLDEKKTIMILCDFRRVEKEGDNASWQVTTPPIGAADRTYKARGWEIASDYRHLDWQLETPDGSNIKVLLDGKEYDASKGNLFLVKTKGGKTEVEQLTKDLSAAKADREGMEAFARKDAAVSKFLGIKAD
jgi:hypothetical protein